MPYHPLGALVVLCAAMLALATPASADSSRSYFRNCQPETGANATVVLTETTSLFILNRPGHLDLLEPGDEIAAFTPEGRCVGRIDWEGETQALTIWEDDPLTSQKDGYTPGDPLIFRAWSVSRRTELSSIFVQYREEFNTSGDFSTDAIYLPRLIYFFPSDRMGGNAREAAVAAAKSATASDTRSAAPDAFTLASNYPNPFSGSTTIRYGLPEAADVRLDVYDALGRRVATLVDGTQPAAWHEVDLRARDLAPGLYIYRLRANDFVSQRQMVLVR